MRFQVGYLKAVLPVNIEGEKLKFVDDAEHVGIVRSIHGNMPNILIRITAHTKTLAASLHHRGNPAANLKLDEVYSVPVLLSGLGALVLNKSEVDILEIHHRETSS